MVMASDRVEERLQMVRLLDGVAMQIGGRQLSHRQTEQGHVTPAADLTSLGARQGLLGDDASEAAATLGAVARAGVDLEALAAQLQADGRDAFSADFGKLLRGIDAKASDLG